jgi:S1-C subfamily serine protease
VIPAAIAWNTADAVLQGRLKRGYLGLAGQRVELPEGQRGADGTEHALLVIGVTNGGPAAQAGLLVGDLLLAFDGQPVSSPEQLLGRLLGTAGGRSAPITVLRGQSRIELTVTLGERPQ